MSMKLGGGQAGGPPVADDPLDPAPPLRLGRLLAVIALVVGVFFVGFGGWAAFVPMESAAIAPGTIIVESNRKTIQHLEGGIVAEIRVNDGDRVQTGDVLLVMRDARSQSERELLRGRLAAALAQRSRLKAERDGQQSMTLDPQIEALLPDAAARATLVEGERTVFRERANFLASQTALNRQSVRDLEQQIAGLRDEIAAADRQLKLIAEEETGLASLVEKGLARRPALLQLQRESANLSGIRAGHVSDIARARQQIGEAELTLVDLRTRLLNEVVAELRDTEAEIADLSERLFAADDVIRRTEVVAPVDGIVVNKRVFTTGGVVAPGAPVLDIVPVTDSLTVEARVQPNDIDVVHAGLRARVRISVFRIAENPILTGTVQTVSADALIDEQTGASFYLARIQLGDLSGLPKDAVLQPGMPAEVMIVTGERTALDYLVEPIRITLNRALREG